MRIWRRVLLAGVLLSGLTGASRDAMVEPACTEATFEDDRFTVCRYVGGRDDLRLANLDRDGAALGSFGGLRRWLGDDAPRLAFAMNAGMYDPAQRPVGLFVAAGRELRPLDRRDGAGNFYLKPNGVFWTDAAGAPHVTETEAFAALAAKPAWATQSGPLLVSGGTMHPAISANGPSLLKRNGVGVRGNEALFVISEGRVSFGRLARFMRDGLGCPDVLFLDGTVSSLWAPEFGRRDGRTDLGTFVAVLRRHS